MTALKENPTAIYLLKDQRPDSYINLYSKRMFDATRIAISLTASLTTAWDSRNATNLRLFLIDTNAKIGPFKYEGKKVHNAAEMAVLLNENWANANRTIVGISDKAHDRHHSLRHWRNLDIELISNEDILNFLTAWKQN